jgi:uncharacterized protein HemX
MLPLAIGLGVGALQGLQQQQQAEKDRKLQAITAQYSPWTHMAPQPVKEANMLGAVAGGGLTGAGIGQNMQAAEGQDQMNQAQLEALQSQTEANKRMNPWGGMSQGPMRQNGSYYGPYGQ